jgi:hypothetical protein
MKKMIIPVLALMFLGGAVFFYVENRKDHKKIMEVDGKLAIQEKAARDEVRSLNDQTKSVNNAGEAESSIGNPRGEANGNDSVKKEKTIEIFNLESGAVVKSPLEIKGEARGWYFEGIFPVRIEDENGKILGMSKAEAQDEWMKDEPVPFLVRLIFNPGKAEQGKIIFQKDNPSGNPEFDESYEVPVRFKEVTEERILQAN